MSVLDTIRCVVLNSTHEPLTVVPARNGLLLYLEGKAVISQEHPTHVIHSAHDIWPVPTQIILKNFVPNRPNVPAILTQRNLFLRDDNQCQYCLRTKAQLTENEKLTRDHVQPISRGGKDKWLNVVTACSTCNNKKADYLLSEINMVLHNKPWVPTIVDLWYRAGIKIKPVT